ncbi:MAG: hypothetical protein J6V70_08715, partial [Kiritimatiellae bacterium]|nr:hypothetical protein [Kiritimatiellia bacterium]
FSPRKGFEVQKIVRGWKSFTAHEINKNCNHRGSVWSYKFWDMLIRDSKHYINVLKYIQHNNPKAAWVKQEIKDMYLKQIDDSHNGSDL